MALQLVARFAGQAAADRELGFDGLFAGDDAQLERSPDRELAHALADRLLAGALAAAQASRSDGACARF